MTPLSVQAMQVLMAELVEDLDLVGGVGGPGLRDDHQLRRAVERVPTQVVDLESSADVCRRGCASR